MTSLDQKFRIRKDGMESRHFASPSCDLPADQWLDVGRHRRAARRSERLENWPSGLPEIGIE